MPVAELSSAFVRQASCPSGQRKIDYFDSNQRGFLIEIRCSGRKTYYQRYCDERGRERQFKIGRADVLTTEQARRSARSVLARAVLGENPQMRRQELRLIPTLVEFVGEKYLPFIKTYKQSWGTDETVLRIHVLPSLGKMALDEIRAEAIIGLIARMRSDGYAVGTSNRVVMILRYMYNLAAKWKVPGVTRNPTGGIELGQESQRNRFLTREIGAAPRRRDHRRRKSHRRQCPPFVDAHWRAAQRNHPGKMGARALEGAQTSGAAVEVGQAAMDRTKHVGNVAPRFDPEARRLRLHFPIVDHRTAVSLVVVSVAANPCACGIAGRAAARPAALVCEASSSMKASHCTWYRRCSATPMPAPRSAMLISPATL